ncbi:aminotransferase class I and II [Colletotrichum plurivorum]|uniref:Aminotransferase class I and II n=1 Tax=Colletotrichum plurivorum TaxID=2175906 RepID=A0A8H6MUN2_9PEZI|nr:aminotransferase class I and II [Colletotrichum plurivorum]
MGDVDGAIISVPVAARPERQRTSSALSTGTTSTIVAIKTRCPPRVARTQKVRELLQLALKRLQVVLGRSSGPRRSISNNNFLVHNHVEPLFSWFGANNRLFSRHIPSRIEVQDDVGTSIKIVTDASHNDAGFHKAATAVSEIEKLQRLCLELLPVSEADAVPALCDETHKAVAEFLDADFCFMTGSGHGANYIALPALVGCSTVVIADEGCRGAVGAGVFRGVCKELRRFRHNDVGHLETLLESCVGGVGDVVVVIEGLYRIEADVPPLDDIYRLKTEYGFTLYCDESHSFLALGNTGRGCLEHWNNQHPDSPVPADLIDIRTGTLSNTINGVGGFVTGRAQFEDSIRDRVDNLDNGEILSLPSSTMVQTLWALGQPLKTSRGIRRLAEISRFCREELERFGIFVYGDAEAPVLPVLPVYTGRPSLSAQLSRELRGEGFSAVAVCTPDVPFWESRVRVELDAERSDDEVNRLIAAVIRAAALVGICRPPGAVRFLFKTDLVPVAAEEDEAVEAYEKVRRLVKMDAAMSHASFQRRLFESTCGPRILDIGHSSRVKNGISAQPVSGVCPPRAAVDRLIARATGMQAGLVYADASIGLSSAIAALSRPKPGYAKNYVLFQRGASQFVRDGLATAPRGEASVMMSYIDLFQLVQQVRRLSRGNAKLRVGVYVRVGEDSAHHLLSNVLEEIASLTGPESVLTVMLHCTSRCLDPRELISFPSRSNVNVLVCGSFGRIFGLPAGFLTGPETLVRELRCAGGGCVFGAESPTFVMDMLHAALEWNLSEE